MSCSDPLHLIAHSVSKRITCELVVGMMELWRCSVLEKKLHDLDIPHGGRPGDERVVQLRDRRGMEHRRAIDIVVASDLRAIARIEKEKREKEKSWGDLLNIWIWREASKVCRLFLLLGDASRCLPRWRGYGPGLRVPGTAFRSPLAPLPGLVAPSFRTSSYP